MALPFTVISCSERLAEIDQLFLMAQRELAAAAGVARVGGGAAYPRRTASLSSR